MAIENLFSKRMKVQRGEVPDVYVYDELPEKLRVQILQVLGETVNVGYGLIEPLQDVYPLCVRILRKERAVFALARAAPEDSEGELRSYFLEEKTAELALDVVELALRQTRNLSEGLDRVHRAAAMRRCQGAIDEINARFKEHGVGYQFVDGQIIRIDSELLHSEVVKPALVLLHSPHYAGAQEEFLKAHEHYRAGNAKEALNECLKAFESVMKSICDKRGWAFDKSRATASVLIKVCVDKGLIPPFWDAHYNALKSLLETGVPTGRNKLGGHGQGTTPTEVPPHIVAYMLHMTASAIVFLAEAEKALV